MTPFNMGFGYCCMKDDYYPYSLFFLKECIKRCFNTYKAML